MENPAMPNAASPTAPERRAAWFVRTVFAAALGLLVSVCGSDAMGPDAAHAEGAGTQPRKPAAGTPKNPRLVWGATMFDQAIAWINDKKPGVNNIKSFYADLHDVQLDVGDTHQEGFLRLWFLAPDKFRQELRQRREWETTDRAGNKILTPHTIKILAGDRMWVKSSTGVARRVHGTAEGAKSVRQLQQDRDRLADIAKFLTLSGLKGPGVKFEYLGPTEGTGTFGGKWVKIRRSFPGGATMDFFFAYDVNANRQVSQVKHPGVVVVMGDAAKREPTEAYVLSKWKKGPQFRFPGKIEAFSRSDWVPNAKYRRFLLAFPNDLRINPHIVAETFDPKR